LAGRNASPLVDAPAGPARARGLPPPRARRAGRAGRGVTGAASRSTAVAPPAELLRALAHLAEPPGPAHGPLARALGLGDPPDAAAHADVFLFQLHPHASVHLGPEGMLGGEARARVAGFWGGVGREPPAEPDHLASLVALYAALAEEEAGASAAAAPLVGRARRALLAEHQIGRASWRES